VEQGCADEPLERRHLLADARRALPRARQGWRMTLPGMLWVDFAMNASRASASG
jgi:hypothetical protein